MKKIIFIFSLLIISGPLLAQIGISGQVSDDITGETLPGATIYIEGTTTGTITDIDGAFSIEVNAESAVLVVSFVGYITKEIVVGSQRVINVALEEDVQTLKEVVVTALGIKREKNALGYAVQDVKGDEVARTNPENVISALQGKVAGAQIVSSSGQVGASSTIQIRGNKSFKGSNQPLFVVDGTPIMNGVSSARVNSTYTDFGNAAMDIDPSNIESISILKGASASALYGSRAANGVVLITTKKGAKRKGIGVEFSTSFAVDEVYILPNYQNEYGQGLKTSEYDYSLWLEDEENAGKSYQDFHNEMGFSWALDGSGGQM
ncbi:MAG: carboxypeptidase-like regulatory domain-containing protein, partial [Bacteroidota bacterium]